MHRRVVIVVPCFNEEGRLHLDAFESYAKEHPDTGFFFVDDGSTDGSKAIISGAVEESPDLFQCLILGENLGKAEAVRAGMNRAISNGAATVGFWDADLATPLTELPAMLGILDASSVVEGVLGARVRLLGRSIKRRPSRHYLGRLFGTVASAVLRLPVYDTQCGAKLFLVTKELREALRMPFQSRWVFDVELLGRLRVGWGSPAADRLEEYPLREWEDIDGSKLRSTHFLRAAIDLLKIWRGLPPLGPKKVGPQ